MKKVLSLVIAFTILFTLTLTASALEPGEGADFYVYDEPGVLSQSTKDAIYELNSRLEEQYGAQLFIVFLNYFGNTDPDELAVSLFNDWQVSDYGMLLVASVKEEAGSMTVGAKIYDRFKTDDINSYLEKYFADDFYDGKYDDAVLTLSDKLAGWYEDEFGSSVSSAPSESKPSGGFWAGLASVVGLIFGFIFRNLFVILICVLIIVIIISSDRRRYRGYYSSLGMPIPRYYPWYIFAPRRPYRSYRPPRPTPPPPSPGPRRPMSPPRSSGSYRQPPSSRGHSGGTGSFRAPSSRPSGSSGFRPRGGGMGGRSGGSVGGFGRRR